MTHEISKIVFNLNINTLTGINHSTIFYVQYKPYNNKINFNNK